MASYTKTPAPGTPAYDNDALQKLLDQYQNKDELTRLINAQEQARIKATSTAKPADLPADYYATTAPTYFSRPEVEVRSREDRMNRDDGSGTSWHYGSKDYEWSGGGEDWMKNWGSKYGLDPNRSWKTTWADMPYDPRTGDYRSRPWESWNRSANFTSWHDPAYRGWQEGVHATTGRSRQEGEWWSSGDDDFHFSRHAGEDAASQLEVLDYDAYNRDPQYTKWAQKMGFGKINSIQDILDIENAWVGQWDDPREGRTAYDANQKAYADATAAVEKFKSTQPKYLDVGGKQVPVGGVQEYLQQQQKQQQSLYDAQLKQQNTWWESNLKAMQEAWGAQSKSELDALGTKWGTLFDKQQASYQTQLADLTSSWDKQAGDYTSKIGSLNQSLVDSRKLTDDYLSKIKGFKEQQLKDLERQRTAAAWGFEGKAMNQLVGGVASGKATQLGGDKIKSSSIKDNFNRTGLRIDSLNLA